MISRDGKKVVHLSVESGYLPDDLPERQETKQNIINLDNLYLILS